MKQKYITTMKAILVASFLATGNVQAGTAYTTQPATSITATSAILNGTATSTIGLSGEVFNWGLTTAYGNKGAGSPQGVNGLVSMPVSGLACNTTYHFKFTGDIKPPRTTTQGTDLTFTTLACPPPHVVILWPDSVKYPVNPRLVYQCPDVTCDNLTGATQLEYVTAVPVQTQYGGVSPAPSPITFLKPADGPVSYMIFVSDTASVSPASTWKSCSLSVDGNGNVVASNTTCSGAVKTGNATHDVSTIAFGAPPFATTVATPPTGYQAYNTVPDRTITFKNTTQFDLCLNLQSKFNTTGCTGTGDQLVAKGSEYVLQVSGAANGGGSMSHAAFVTGYLDGTTWHYSGHNNQAGVYATAMEWSLFPTAPIGTPPANTTDHSVGMSDVDISVVNGYNFGVTLSSSSGAVCSSATTVKGLAQPALYKYYTGSISEFPKNAAKFNSLCPAKSVFKGSSVTQVVTDSSNNFLGCLSPCQYAAQIQSAAGISATQLNAICCSGTYDNSSLCTTTKIPWGNNKNNKFNFITHSNLPYVKNIKSNSKNVYTWQFDDDNGNFSCEPGASYVFEIKVE